MGDLSHEFAAARRRAKLLQGGREVGLGGGPGCAAGEHDERACQRSLRGAVRTGRVGQADRRFERGAGIVGATGGQLVGTQHPVGTSSGKLTRLELASHLQVGPGGGTSGSRLRGRDDDARLVPAGPRERGQVVGQGLDP